MNNIKLYTENKTQSQTLIYSSVYLIRAARTRETFMKNDRCYNKKLSYCWETVRRESMPRIAEMDVEMTT